MLQSKNDDEADYETRLQIKEKTTPGCYVKVRYSVLIMTTLGFLNLFALRNVINIAIIAMVAKRPSSSMNNDSSNTVFEYEFCPVEETNSSMIEEAKTINNLTNASGFDWSLKQQGALLSSAFYAYIVSNVLGAWIAKRMGIRITMSVAGLSSSILTLFMPTAAKSSFVSCLVLRVVIGFLQGPTFPTGMTGAGIWALPTERSRFLAIMFSGPRLGIFIVYPFVGIMISTYGWEAAFYVVGTLGIVWSIAWIVLIHNTPAEHPRISKEEREYLSRSMKGQEQIGVLAALPSITRFVVQIVTAFVVDFLLMKNLFRTVRVRKVITGVSFILESVSMIVLCYVGCNRIAAVTMFILTIGLGGVSYAGYRSTVIDIAPSLCGILYGLSNFLASILYFTAPLLTGFILDAHAGQMTGWNIVFWSCSGILLVGVIIYLLFATDSVQDWAKQDHDSNDNKDATAEDTKLFHSNE